MKTISYYCYVFIFTFRIITSSYEHYGITNTFTLFSISVVYADMQYSLPD